MTPTNADTATIIDSTINFINTTYASFSYDEETCRRDVGLIVDAMVHDPHTEVKQKLKRLPIVTLRQAVQ